MTTGQSKCKIVTLNQTLSHTEPSGSFESNNELREWGRKNKYIQQSQAPQKLLSVFEGTYCPYCSQAAHLTFLCNNYLKHVHLMCTLSG